MTRMVCERFGQRPSSLWDTENELTDMEKIYLDYLILIVRSNEASQTLDPREIEGHIAKIKNKKK